ncbi:hypothetical protein PIB30_055335 [Stylosanthes scabra]|uniref:Uncharacterized protein n=1 Tax=Stylosanthes scabra TaxID=79078 RepID=A0ABU6UIX4_9FABA|nr:hypothetical protein [Stylosanthes scabra]
MTRSDGVRVDECRNNSILVNRVRGTASRYWGVTFLVSEQFYPYEPEEWNCYAPMRVLNQRKSCQRSCLWQRSVSSSCRNPLVTALVVERSRGLDGLTRNALRVTGSWIAYYNPEPCNRKGTL